MLSVWVVRHHVAVFVFGEQLHRVVNARNGTRRQHGGVHEDVGGREVVQQQPVVGARHGRGRHGDVKDAVGPAVRLEERDVGDVGAHKPLQDTNVKQHTALHQPHQLQSRHTGDERSARGSKSTRQATDTSHLAADGADGQLFKRPHADAVGVQTFQQLRIVRRAHPRRHQRAATAAGDDTGQEVRLHSQQHTTNQPTNRHKPVKS